MRKSGIKAVIIATALAMTVPTIATTTVTAKKKAKKTVVKLVSLDTAARKYVNKANASANKKKGTTSLTVSVKGSVSEGKSGRSSVWRTVAGTGRVMVSM